MRTTVMTTAGCGAVADHRSPVALSAPTRKRPCKGPLGSHLDGFAKHLLREGYSPATLINKRWLVANLSRWLDRRRLKIDDLNEEQVRHFCAHRSARGRRTDRITLRELLVFLRHVGCIRQPPPEKSDRSALGKLMRDFERFLIAETKFGKSRYVPVHRSTQCALQRYANLRDRLCPHPDSPSFFLLDGGTRPGAQNARDTFVRLCRQIGLRRAGVSRGPRILDLRHRLAINTVTRWHRCGVDVERRLPQLSTFLGHTHITHTQWYLTATPQLLRQVMRRVERSERDRRP